MRSRFWTHSAKRARKFLFQGDYESYSEYIVTPAGGDTALLTTNGTCIPFDPQPGVVCRNYVTLTFNPY